MTEKTNFFLADLLGRCFTQGKRPFIQIINKQILLQNHFVRLTHYKQSKPEPFIVKHEFVLPSQKDGCYPILADFANDHISIRINDSGEKTIFKLLGFFSFEAVKHSKVI